MPSLKKGKMCGVLTGDMGVNENGLKGDNYQPGMALEAKNTVLLRGARGSLTKDLTQHFKLDQNSQPQTYAIGFKGFGKFQKRSIKREYTYGTPSDGPLNKKPMGALLYIITASKN